MKPMNTDPMKTEAWKTMTPDERIAALRDWMLSQPGAVPLNAGTFPDPHGQDRQWRFVTYLQGHVWLVVQCQKTGAWGVVKECTLDEWRAAPDWRYNPPIWPEYWRVTLLKQSPLEHWK